MKDIILTDFTDKRFTKAFKTYFDELGIPVKEWDRLFVSMTKEGENTAFVRLTDDDEVLGFIQVKPIVFTSWFFDVKMGFIREFWIDSAYRGSKHGTELLAKAESFFLENGIYKSILTTHTADGFYLKHGYKKHDDINARNNDSVYIKQL